MHGFFFFDLDGTLADTDGDIRIAWKKALGDLDLETPDFDEKFVTGPPIEEVVKTLFPDRFAGPQAAPGAALIAAARERFGFHYDASGFPNTREYPGILARVRALKDAGARVFIVTNKRYVGATLMARRFGWDALFERVFAGDMWKDDPAVGKLRKPELLARVMTFVGATPEASVMVGDTSSDFEAAVKNGVASIGVTWGYGTDAELKMADRLVDAPEEIE